MVAVHPNKDARRSQLLDTALALFAQKGYHETSIHDIIERAQVARGTFYNYFDSKRQIFEKLLDQLFDTATAAAFPISTVPGSDVPAQLRGNISALCSSLLANLAVTRVLLEHAVGLDAEANAQLKRFYDRVLARVERAIRDGQRMGIVRAGSPRMLATCLVGMLKEALYQQILGTYTPSVDELVGEIFNVAARGILAAPSVNL